jgi:hypothetical protein
VDTADATLWQNVLDRIRIPKTAYFTGYVRGNGNDANDGLSSTTAKATPQAMYDEMATRYDFRGSVVELNIGPGEYISPTQGLNTFMPLIGCNGFVIRGASAATTILRSTGAAEASPHGLAIAGIWARWGQVRDLHLIGPYIPFGIWDSCPVSILGDVICESTASSSHSNLHVSDAKCSVFGNIILRGSSYRGASAYKAVFELLSTSSLAVEGTPNYAYGSVVAEFSSYFYVSSQATVSGSTTGARYSVWGNSILNTEGGGANRFPGNQAGNADAATGGYYI